jgi:hypothetical protein
MRKTSIFSKPHVLLAGDAEGGYIVELPDGTEMFLADDEIDNGQPFWWDGEEVFFPDWVDW